MILRQLIGRHGRTFVSRSNLRRAQRTYATEIDLDHPANRQSERDHSPVQEISGHPGDPSSILDAIQHDPFEKPWEETTEALLSSFNEILASTPHEAVQQGRGLEILGPEKFLEHTQKDTDKIRKALKFLHAKIHGLKQDEHWIGFAQEAIDADRGLALLGPSQYYELLQTQTQRLQYQSSALHNAIAQRRSNNLAEMRRRAEEILAIDAQEQRLQDYKATDRNQKLEQLRAQKAELSEGLTQEQQRVLAHCQQAIAERGHLKDEQAIQFAKLFAPQTDTSATSALHTSKAKPLYDESTLPPNSNPLWALKDSRFATVELRSAGSTREDIYQPWQILQNPPFPEHLTLPLLLANQTHLGHATALWHPGNSNYIFGIRQGIHIISLEITLSYLRRAAKVVQEVARRGGIILFVGTRKGHREIVVSSAKLAEPAYHIFSRWIPGSLTNGQQILGDCALKVVNVTDVEQEQYRVALGTSTHAALRPDLVICLNPQENEVCLHECGLYNVPTVGIVDTDTNPAWVTYPVPANDDSLRSVALISGVLARAAQRGQILRLDTAKEGKTTYNTRRVVRALKRMEEIASLNVQTPGRGDKDSEKDVD